MVRHWKIDKRRQTRVVPTRGSLRSSLRQARKARCPLGTEPKRAVNSLLCSPDTSTSGLLFWRCPRGAVGDDDAECWLHRLVSVRQQFRCRGAPHVRGVDARLNQPSGAKARRASGKRFGVVVSELWSPHRFVARPLCIMTASEARSVVGAAIGLLQRSKDRVEVERGRLLTRRERRKRFDLLGDDGLHRIHDIGVR